MRLKQIKLAGFKSFVDITKVPFEQQMTAIVGPNGCGKSNIIDAVRWVLGESSAKNLRGDTMTDVIFNGATSRKPVSQASVELLFNNTDDRFKDSMASRNEIAIRRVMNRDGTNTYYLNNAKCRRKDITDIFLGTGLGPRSYAIIEQGTISRLIESKPQELRVFIEEAAGISKYKERRRDTENRIRHTRENLTRLADIRSELTLQVDKLHQQAEAAKRFKTLKTQERKYKAELCVLRFKQFSDKYEAIVLQLNQLQIQVEQFQVSLKENDIELFKLKQQDSFNDGSINELQQLKLQLNTDIARTEQTITHANQLNVQLNKDVEQVKKQHKEQQLLLEQSKEQYLSVNKWLVQEQEGLLLVEQQINLLEQDIVKDQQIQHDCQQKWENCYQQQNKQLKQQALLNGQLLTQQQLLLDKKNRIKEIQQTLEKNKGQLQELELNKINNELTLKKQSFEESNKQYNVIEKQRTECSTKSNHLELHISQQQGIKTGLQSNLMQLEAMQNAQPDWFNQQSIWLKTLAIEVKESVHQKIKIAAPWQEVGEQVLQQWLQAQLINELPTKLPLETAFLVKNSPSPTVKLKRGTLATVVSGEYAFTAFFNKIYLADDLKQAHQILTTLSIDESVICPDTTWLGHDFLRKGTVEQSSGLLQRHQDIKQLKDKIAQLEISLTDDSTLNQQLQADLIDVELGFNEVFKQGQQIQQQINQLEQKQALEQQKQQQLSSQQTAWQQQLSELESQSEKIHTQLLDYQQQQQAFSTQSEISDQFNQLTKQKEHLQQQINKYQQQLKQLQNERHQCALTFEQAKYQKKQIELTEKETLKQSQLLQNKIASLSKQISDNQEPLTLQKKSLQLWLTKLSDVDLQLAEMNQGQLGADLTINNIEQNKITLQQQIDKIKEQINAKQLSAESYKLRAQAAKEQLNEQQQNYDNVLADMPENIQENIWQAHIVKLAKQLNQLGAINLAAIDEYESQFERKLYLDQQNDDLTEAISTLESAIAKIDKESRHKFQLTFEKVNNDLKILFPKVFGGGHAYLEMTGQDFLDTGITIMARPPGKKNSTIHLLSGGEKALTALSLVFAIFRLNPAPFCMLDEVDAPLDDANVERFCNLVREMSQTVQFIYISHNKIAMEMASHLTGVTMFEPGVSRMVAVDIDEAVAMAEITN